MTTTLPSTQAPAWSQAVLHPGQEFEITPLPVLSGSIPAGLRGSLYRNGPARLQRNGQSVGHWFDGDGAVLGVHFSDGGATGVYRYVQTQGWQQESQVGHYTQAGYGMLPPGSWLTRLNKPVKNPANTSVLALSDKLLALWEGGEPHAMNLETLKTIGLDDLGWLAGRPFSAHPRRDPVTGDILNFGVSTGAKTTLNLYRTDASGNLRQQGAVPLKGLELIHDCVLAGRYLIFCIPPIHFDLLPLIARLKSFSDAMTWKPDRGTEIIVCDRTTLQVISRSHTDPWFQWHFGNGYELPDGSVVIHLVRYPDSQPNQRLKEVASGQLQTAADSLLWQLRLNPQTGQVLEMEQVCDRPCEFPVTAPQEVGQPSRYTYLSLHRQGTNTRTEIYDAIARLDHQTGTLTEADLGNHHYPTEPIYAPDADQPDQGWILTVVYDGNTHSSEVWVFNAAALDQEPVCRLALPQVIPPSFHGTWKSG
jgi:carotenoid cleavage dioxygenase-like enzyme